MLRDENKYNPAGGITTLHTYKKGIGGNNKFKNWNILFQELDAVNKMISEGKLKANEIRNNLKNLETTSTR